VEDRRVGVESPDVLATGDELFRVLFDFCFVGVRFGDSAGSFFLFAELLVGVARVGVLDGFWNVSSSESESEFESFAARLWLAFLVFFNAAFFFLRLGVRPVEFGSGAAFSISLLSS